MEKPIFTLRKIKSEDNVKMQPMRASTLRDFLSFKKQKTKVSLPKIKFKMFSKLHPKTRLKLEMKLMINA